MSAPRWAWGCGWKRRTVGALLHRLASRWAAFARFRRAASTLKNCSAVRAEKLRSACPQAADAIADAADLVDDHEGSAEYKRHLIHVYLRRVFEKALA